MDYTGIKMYVFWEYLMAVRENAFSIMSINKYKIQNYIIYKPNFCVYTYTCTHTQKEVYQNINASCLWMVGLLFLIIFLKFSKISTMNLSHSNWKKVLNITLKISHVSSVHKCHFNACTICHWMDVTFLLNFLLRGGGGLFPFLAIITRALNFCLALPLRGFMWKTRCWWSDLCPPLQHPGRAESRDIGAGHFWEEGCPAAS